MEDRARIPLPLSSISCNMSFSSVYCFFLAFLERDLLEQKTRAQAIPLTFGRSCIIYLWFGPLYAFLLMCYSNSFPPKLPPLLNFAVVCWRSKKKHALRDEQQPSRCKNPNKKSYERIYLSQAFQIRQSTRRPTARPRRRRPATRTHSTTAVRAKWPSIRSTPLRQLH